LSPVGECVTRITNWTTKSNRIELLQNPVGAITHVYYCKDINMVLLAHSQVIVDKPKPLPCLASSVTQLAPPRLRIVRAGVAAGRGSGKCLRPQVLDRSECVAEFTKQTTKQRSVHSASLAPMPGSGTCSQFWDRHLPIPFPMNLYGRDVQRIFLDARHLIL
jgi:hypothetical protein